MAFCYFSGQKQDMNTKFFNIVSGSEANITTSCQMEFLLGLKVQKIQNAVIQKKFNNEKWSTYHNLSSPNQKI